MSSWGCESGNQGVSNVGTIGSPTPGSCVTTPGSTFSEPVTLNIYNVGPGNTVGASIYSTTQTFAIPYRPSADAGHCGAFADGAGGPVGSDYYDGTNCEAELASNVTFTLPHLTVPNSVIYGVAMNTSGFGATPYGYSNPCNSCEAPKGNGFGKRSSRAIPRQWKTELTEAELTRLRRSVGDIADAFYLGSEW